MNSLFKWKVVSVSILLALIILGAPSIASAYPGFARRYETSCITCHTAYPKLNDFGRAFRWNGHQIPDDPGDGYVDDFFVGTDRPDVPMGADAWKDVFPAGVWPNSITGDAPIGFQAQSRITRTSGAQGADGPATDFKFPTGIGLISGAALGEDISYWARLQFGDDSVEIERAYVTFTDLTLDGASFAEEGIWGGLPDNVLNLRLGRIDPWFLGYSNHVDRYTLAGFNVNGFKAGDNPWQAEPSLTGAELWGCFGGSFMYVAGVSNGTATNDNNSDKDGYARIALKFGGVGFDGSTSGGAVEDLAELSGAQDDSFTIGAFAYQGQNTITKETTGQTWDDRFYRVGGDMRLTFGDFNLFGTAMFGLDRNAFGNTNPEGHRSVAWYCEADYVIYPWLIPVVRYEYSNEDGYANNVNSVIASLTILIRSNVKLVIERKAQFEEHSTSKQPGTLQFALDVSF
ncbi:MAG: hypothetical protein NUW37_11215 [Planctomycetes bacterium]|nr:hypothetical protein [Planctomycetota bacterium]